MDENSTHLTKAPAGLLADPNRLKVRKTIVLREPYWEKQFRESAKQYQAFEIGLKMEPTEREIMKIAQQLGRHPSLVYRWSTMNKWSVRFEAYDQKNLRERLDLYEKGKRERYEMELELAQTFAFVGGTRAQDLYKLIKAREQDPSIELTISDKDAAHWAEFGIKWMRLLDNLPTEHMLVETPQMMQERMLREAVADITELYRLDPRIALEDRIKWASEDYQLDPQELASAVHGYIDESEKVEM